MYCEYEFCNFFIGITLYEYIVNDCFVTFFSTIIQTFRVILLCTYLLQNSYPLCFFSLSFKRPLMFLSCFLPPFLAPRMSLRQTVNVRGLLHLFVGSHHAPDGRWRPVHQHDTSRNGEAKCHQQSHGDVPCHNDILVPAFPSTSATVMLCRPSFRV